MRVVDASALIEVLMLTDIGLEIGTLLFEEDRSLHAPELIDLEVTQVTRRLERLGDLSEERGAALLQDLSDVAVERYPHRPLLPRVWELRRNLAAYDAAYIALAEALDAPLLTRDARLKAAPHRARVEVL